MSTASTPDAARPGLSWIKGVGLIVGLATAVALMLIAFATPAAKSGAHDVPIAIAGPEQAVSRLEAAVQQQNPGAITVQRVQDPAAVTDAIQHRDAVGGIVLGADGAQIQTASAAGAPYAALLKGLGSGLSEQGQKVTYRDVAPLTADDPAGAGLSAIGLPLAFGGMISALALSRLIRRRGARAVASISFAVVAGVAATSVLWFVTGTFDQHFWLIAAAVAVGIAAVSLTVLGLESVLGYAGFGVGALLMMFLANPLSGIGTGWQWLPQPWGAIGQFLPLGAAGELVRSAAFFEGTTARPVIVLTCWIALGLLLLAVSGLRSRGATSEDSSDDADEAADRRESPAPTLVVAD